MKQLTTSFSNYLLKISPILNYKINNNELVIKIYYTDIIKILYVLKLHTNCQFKYISDICAIDYLNNKNRFIIIYNLLSIRYNSRIRIKTQMNSLDSIESVSSLFSCASWWEREIWDMFGIYFLNHLDLRRILTDYGFEGFPLRKDFPLIGFLEVRYNFINKSVIFNKIITSQKFNLFNFKNPWKNF